MRRRLAALAAAIAVAVITGAWPASATSPTDLYWATTADPAVWPVADIMRRWDRSDAVTLHEVPDCASAPGPCLTVTAADRLPSWYDNPAQPPGAEWTDWTVTADTYEQTPGRSTAVLTTLADEGWDSASRLTGRNLTARAHRGLTCHEIGHWILQRDDTMHDLPYGCLSEWVTHPYPGRRARALVPSWAPPPAPQVVCSPTSVYIGAALGTEVTTTRYECSDGTSYDDVTTRVLPGSGSLP